MHPVPFADGPPPSRTTRQFPRYEEIAEPEERRRAVIRLHAQGWSISAIARYLDVSRPTIYTILKRWVEEGVRGLSDKSHANTSKPGVDLPTRNLIRKKQEENPLLGEWRMYAALKHSTESSRNRKSLTNRSPTRSRPQLAMNDGA